MNLDVDRFLEDLTGRHARTYAAAIQELLVAVAMQRLPAVLDARKRLEKVMTETMGIGEVLGASIALRQAAALTMEAEPERFQLWATRRELWAFAEKPVQSIIPRVTFAEAVQDMLDRTPVTLRRAAERTASRIAQLYGEGHVVAFARSAETAVTERVQSLIAEAVREGIPEADRIAGQRVRPGAARLITLGVDEVAKRTEPWALSYAKTAFRTNLNTAVTAGRFRQAQDPDIKQVMPAFIFDAVGDNDTRDNHQAADGLVLRVDNPAWRNLAPPLGYNCRCQVRFVGTPELRRMGRINEAGEVREDRVPAGAHPDPGFRHGGRPDLLLNQGGGL